MKLYSILSLFFGASGFAATFSVNPIADTFVSATNSNSNYGNAGGLSVASASLPKGEFDALLKFDLASARASFDAAFGAGLWTVDSVTLQLAATPPNNVLFNGNGAGPAGSNVNFAGLFSIKWMVNDSWIEGTGTPSAPGASGITFSTLPAFLSGMDESLGTFSFGGATSGNDTWNLGLTSSFLADVSAGATVSLLMLPEDAGVSYLSNSRSIATASLRPQLTVNASVPEPGAALLAGMAAMGFARRRRDALTVTGRPEVHRICNR